MTEKQRVISTLNRLPENASFEEITNEFEILRALQEAEKQADEGYVHSHQKVKETFDTWFTK